MPFFSTSEGIWAEKRECKTACRARLCCLKVRLLGSRPMKTLEAIFAVYDWIQSTIGIQCHEFIMVTLCYIWQSIIMLHSYFLKGTPILHQQDWNCALILHSSSFVFTAK
ncbi:hypothetical protein SKAU_G00305760 [Synaphobranchus kaupii]|uniref:Uncharacterized protein n=1 Tax=Synaphobranchus kaupii TaxID=118154 RepID=A0A9Q1EQU1_SYNKA|nr:hypothetical protein SKAU_G00305760 [Synaphobranchus kaupii]